MLFLKQWLDDNLWYVLVSFIGLYCFGWVLLWITLAVELIFAKKTNNIEKSANRIFIFCNNLCKYTLYSGVLFIGLAFIFGYLIPLLTKK